MAGREKGESERSDFYGLERGGGGEQSNASESGYDDVSEYRLIHLFLAGKEMVGKECECECGASERGSVRRGGGGRRGELATEQTQPSLNSVIRN